MAKLLKFLTRDELLGASGFKEKIVEVPEWGGSVKLRSLSVAQAERMYGAAQTDKEHPLQLGLMALIESMVEPRLDAGDVPALMEKDADVMARLSTEALALSGMGNRAAAVAEAEKN